MKPIGSITNVFPFIESDDKQLIQSLIEESLNYADFADRLCNYVMSNEPSETMVYLAWHHLDITNNVKAFEKFFDKFSQHSCIHPWFMWWNMTINSSWDWYILQKEVDDAITSSTNPWIQFNLYILKLDCTRGISIDILEEDKIIKKMTDLIKQNRSLEYARSQIYLRVAQRFRNENNQKSLEMYESAVQHTLTHDDVAFGVILRIHMSSLLAKSDPTKGLEIIESAAETVNNLGYLKRKTDLFVVMGGIFDARGEYDAAIKSYEESLELRERLHPSLSPRLIPTALSRAFRRMGHVEEALEWAKMALASKPMLSQIPSSGLLVTGNVNMSAALALLGRVEEAKSYCDSGNELVLNSGVELWLSDIYLCRGLIERADGKFTDALANFERALEILERLQRQGRMNECLMLLAETEIHLQYDETQRVNGILAFHWIDVMEKMARKKNLPGVLGLALLLKTRIQLLQNNNETAEAIMNQVRKLSKNPGTIFLQDKIAVLSSTHTSKRRL